jgi:hypothetical protein
VIPSIAFDVAITGTPAAKYSRISMLVPPPFYSGMTAESAFFR